MANSIVAMLFLPPPVSVLRRSGSRKNHATLVVLGVRYAYLVVVRLLRNGFCSILPQRSATGEYNCHQVVLRHLKLPIRRVRSHRHQNPYHGKRTPSFRPRTHSKSVTADAGFAAEQPRQILHAMPVTSHSTSNQGKTNTTLRILSFLSALEAAEVFCL